MMLSLSLLFLLGTLSTVQSADVGKDRTLKKRYNGLQFGETAQDYVLFKQNMEPLQESYSVCGWVKKRRAGDHKFWFAYSTPSSPEEIRVADNGDQYSFYTLHRGIDLRGKVTVPLGVWTHVCGTWSFSSQTASLYYDGVLLGSVKTPSGRKVDPEGYVVLGQDFNSNGGDFQDHLAFGGELYKVNVFDRELDPSEVKKMADEGLCSEVEEKYGRSRYLKWEDMLLEEKSGNVTEINVGCYPEDKKDCDCEHGNGTSFCRWDLLRGEKFFNKTVTVEMVEELKQSWDILGDFEGATVTEQFISHFKFYHGDENTCN